MKRTLLSLVLFLCSYIMYAQTTISGKVFDEYLEPFPGAVIQSSDAQTSSNFDGEFTLKIKKGFPVTIKVLSVGYQPEVIEVKTVDQELNIILKETNILDEVVVSASRTPERILESPVTIERIGIRDIKKNSSADFYDGLENLKGVDLNTNSLIFKSVNARGFASLENPRFIQLIDGVDNAIPGRNVFAGNLAGVSELDVQSIELLPGAASALYGANALNGVLNIKTKNPFDHQGISTTLKTGFTSQEAAGNNPFYNTTLRMAHAFSNKLAAKVNFTYFEGEEWHATNYANSSGLGGKIIPGDKNLPSYDGVNIYGDIVSTNIYPIAEAFFKAGALPISQAEFDALAGDLNQVVSRTGYEERYLMSNQAKNVKTDVLLNYRPLGDERLEVILNSRFNLGDNISQAGSNRYEQNNGYLEQHELKLKGTNFLVRGYYSKTKSGDSFDTRLAAIDINNSWKPNELWFQEYVGEYLGRLPFEGSKRAHELARIAADNGRALPGSKAFNTLFQETLKKPIKDGGAFFVDNSSLYHFDANMNFKDYIDWAEIQVGGSYRVNLLDSQGNVYTDYTDKIKYYEYGVFTQLRKKMLDDRFKVTASIRYDKSENIEKGNFSPRLALTYAAGEDKNHHFRASYQTAFRNPTAQDQYVGITTGNKDYRIGTVQDNLDRFVGTINGITFTGNEVFNNMFTLSSVEAFGALAANGTINPELLKKANYGLVKPETLTTFELGYRGAFDVLGAIFEVDANTYYNRYNDIINEKIGIYPLIGKVGQLEAVNAIASEDFGAIAVQTNSDVDVSSFGGSLGVYTKLFKSYDLGVSYTYSDYDFDQSQDEDFKLRFNTPKNKVKVQFGNNNLFKNFGFNVNVRWQDAFEWQDALLDGIIEERTVLDAQLNYRVPSLKSRFKIGGTNLTGKEYYGAMGSGLIGSMYYLSWTIND